jgi:hypothetical protein
LILRAIHNLEVRSIFVHPYHNAEFIGKWMDYQITDFHNAPLKISTATTINPMSGMATKTNPNTTIVSPTFTDHLHIFASFSPDCAVAPQNLDVFSTNIYTSLNDDALSNWSPGRTLYQITDFH